MITVSESAKTHFTKILTNEPEGTQIRIFVSNGGSPHAKPIIAFSAPDAMMDGDTKLDYSDFIIYVDRNSAPYLEDAEVDLVTDEMGTQLTLKAPNAKMRKVPEDGSLFDRVNYVLQAEFAPQLIEHGGLVHLVEIDEEGMAVVEFGGGCNGCSMIDVTLKEGIEKSLLHYFPDELKGVKDVTPHQAGEHSFYQ